ncbi:MAG: hypothetical protein ACLQJR_19245 [Stellaceae bacterium]
MATNASISGLVIAYPCGSFVSIRVQSPGVRMQVRPRWWNFQVPLETETSIAGIGNVGVGVVNERVNR